MNRKLVWLSILSIFFLIWGASGLASAAPQSKPLVQSELPRGASTSVVPESTKPVLIPVTGGNPRLGWGTLMFYGLIGLAALTLILALLDSANQSTALYARREASQEENHKNNGQYFPV